MFFLGMLCGVVTVLVLIVVSIIFWLPGRRDDDSKLEMEEMLVEYDQVLEGLPKRVAVLEAHNDLVQEDNPVSWREVAARRAGL